MEELTKEQKRIFDRFNNIFATEKSLRSVEKEIKSIKQFATKMRESYYRFYDTQDSEGNITKGLITKLDEACKRIEENQDKLDKIERYYVELFEGIQADENGKGGKPSLERFIQEKQNAMTNLLATQKEKFETSLQEKEGNYQVSLEKFETKSQELITNKEELINKLLLGATSAGLASAYQKEKENIQKELGKWRNIFWISVIAFLMCFGIYFWNTFDEDFTYVSFLKSLPVWVFSGFFTFFSTKQISEYKRLASEYAYKEALNTTYIGYEKAIQESDNQELKEKLLEVMIRTAEFNPSTTLSKTHGEHPISSLADRAKDFVSSNTKKEQVNMD